MSNKLLKIPACKDFNGISIKKDDMVCAEGGKVLGVITTVWNDGCVDIHHSYSHQGPVIDTYNIVDKEVQKMEEPNNEDPYDADNC